ncbi:helix-turn-helix domain-containing protein [Porticoccus sp. GXU_MW_L64]
MELLTGAQIRMARGLLRWSIQDLADAAGVGASTVKKLEKGNEVARDVRLPLNEAVRDAFLATGQIRFEENACIFLGTDSV